MYCPFVSVYCIVPLTFTCADDKHSGILSQYDYIANVTQKNCIYVRGRQSPARGPNPARELCRSGPRQPVNFNIMSGPQAPSIQPAATCRARVFSRQMHQKMSISGCKQGRIQDFSRGGGGAKLPDIIIRVMICDSIYVHQHITLIIESFYLIVLLDILHYIFKYFFRDQEACKQI